jgi:uncharacterized repeat protein (TIGR01451 family)
MVKKAGTDAWQPARVEMILQPGDTIKTGGFSETTITFFEGSTVEMEADTEIIVAELGISESGATTVRLTQVLGKTVSRVKKLAGAGSSFDIETPAAIAAVRGSVMLVTVTASGRTVVGNEHGDIRITVAGQEYTIREGFQRTIAPGQPPSAEFPIPPPGGYPPPPQARLDASVRGDPAPANVGDVITYTCSLGNTGDLSLQDISAASNISGTATYQGGDVNGNGVLDPRETWVFTATYAVQLSDYPRVVAIVDVSATTTTGITLTDTETVTTPVLPVVITVPAEGDAVHFRTVEVSGLVLDEAFTGGTVSVNGSAGPITVTEGTFKGSATLADGDNTVTVTVTDGQGQTASDTMAVYLEPYAIRIELTWSTGDGTDMDIHLIRPDGAFNDPVGDCYYGNQHPDWGDFGETRDNPYFYIDDFAGWGPEVITLLQPYDVGDYRVMVHYYNDNGTGASEATVRVFIYENLAAEFSKNMIADEVWDCAVIGWPSGTVSQPPLPQ